MFLDLWPHFKGWCQPNCFTGQWQQDLCSLAYASSSSSMGVHAPQLGQGTSRPELLAFKQALAVVAVMVWLGGRQGHRYPHIHLPPQQCWYRGGHWWAQCWQLYACLRQWWCRTGSMATGVPVDVHGSGSGSTEQGGNAAVVHACVCVSNDCVAVAPTHWQGRRPWWVEGRSRWAGAYQWGPLCWRSLIVRHCLPM